VTVEREYRQAPPLGQHGDHRIGEGQGDAAGAKAANHLPGFAPIVDGGFLIGQKPDESFDGV